MHDLYEGSGPLEDSDKSDNIYNSMHENIPTDFDHIGLERPIGNILEYPGKYPALVSEVIGISSGFGTNLGSDAKPDLPTQLPPDITNANDFEQSQKTSDHTAIIVTFSVIGVVIIALLIGISFTRRPCSFETRGPNIGGTSDLGASPCISNTVYLTSAVSTTDIELENIPERVGN